MKDEQRQAAKKRMMTLMQEGRPWQEAARFSGIQTSRSTAYRWFRQFRTQGEAGLHDEQGHPRLATTSRGDQHLTIGLPPILARYQDREGQAPAVRVIVDREGMAAPFLRDRKRAGPHRGDGAAH